MIACFINLTFSFSIQTWGRGEGGEQVEGTVQTLLTYLPPVTAVTSFTSLPKFRASPPCPSLAIQVI